MEGKQKIIGIYRLYNKVTGKSYVGKSINIKRRISQHKTLIKRKLGSSSQAYKYMHEDFKKHGMESFDYEILEECQEEELGEKEQYWIKKFDVFNREKGYNIDEIYRRKTDPLPSEHWWNNIF